MSTTVLHDAQVPPFLLLLPLPSFLLNEQIKYKRLIYTRYMPLSTVRQILSVCRSVCPALSVCLSAVFCSVLLCSALFCSFLSACLSVCLLLCLSICMTAFLPACLPDSLTVKYEGARAAYCQTCSKHEVKATQKRVCL